jgi:salicylate hydroxylase
VRERIAGKIPATSRGDAAWRITIPIERLPANSLDQVMSVWMGPGSHAVAYYIRAPALLNFVAIVETRDVSDESWTAKFPWPTFKKDFEGWHADLQTLIDAADRDEC